MGALVVVAAMALALIFCCRLFSGAAQAIVNDDREAWNAHAREVWLQGGPGFYPQKLEDGSVRWYRCTHVDAMDF